MSKLIHIIIPVDSRDSLNKGNLERAEDNHMSGIHIFEGYLEKIEDLTQQARVAEVLKWVMDKFPELKPKVAWNQPMFTEHGTFIIGFSASKQHMAVSPERAGIEHFSEEILKAGYEHSQQLMRIPWNKPVDFSLLKRMIVYNRLDKAECSTFWRK